MATSRPNLTVINCAPEHDQPNQRQGLLLTVYRDAAHCVDYTNGGVSGRCARLTLVGVVRIERGHKPVIQELDSYSQVFAPDEDAPAVWLVLDYLGARLVPALPDTSPDLGTRYMFGGNFAGSSDGRWDRLVPFYGAVSVHDRAESSR